jgi:hypothetical protein
MSEQQLQETVCNYLKNKYPDVLFRSDLGGIRLSLGQATKVKRVQQSRAWPDLQICEARLGYHGLFIELKKDGARVRLKNGELSTDHHIQEQEAVLIKLRQRGYIAEFAVGYDEAIALINGYLEFSNSKFIVKPI